MSDLGSALPEARGRRKHHRPASAVRRSLAGFRRDEDGSIIMFSLILFMLMILIGGMAVDLMRFETRRVHVQNTLDSAILAAADLDQTLDPEEVVRDYFEKSGYDRDSVDIVLNEERLGGMELVGRSISASTRINVNTLFMHMLDVPVLSTPVAGTATENVQNVEISLVLDISGSMRWGATDGTTVADNRITRLRAARTEPAPAAPPQACETDADGDETCTQPDTTASTTINIIPYAGHVNPGRDMFSLLGGSRWHNWSSCKEVTNSDFDHTDLPRGTPHQLPHFMIWAIDTTWMNWGWCPQDNAAILYAENDYEVIEDYINNIRLHDGTATHIGMKYGVALLNPSSRDEFGVLADRGIIDEAYRNRPSNWEDDVVKYIVLMTDGRTTDQHRPRVPQGGTGERSPWRTDWDYSAIYNQMATGGGLASDPAVVLDGDDISGGIPSDMTVNDTLGDILHRFGSVNRGLDLQDAATVAQGYFDNTGGQTRRRIYAESGTTHNIATNEGHITAMCDLAKEPVIGPSGEVVKEDRITVFTISFFAPTQAVTLMENCASAPRLHFLVQTLNIDSAFEAIAKTINQLRLTL